MNNRGNEIMIECLELDENHLSDDDAIVISKMIGRWIYYNLVESNSNLLGHESPSIPVMLSIKASEHSE